MSPREEPLTVRRPPRRLRRPDTTEVEPASLCDRCNRCPATHDVMVHLVGIRCNTYSMCAACARWAMEDNDDDDAAEEQIVYGSEHVYA